MAILEEAVRRLLARMEVRYRHVGMGQFACTSCGAAMHEDYSDGAKEVFFYEEAHSPSCPWRQLKEAIEPLDAPVEAPAPPAPQTPAPLREAAPEEAATIQELAQAVGLALLRAWDGRPAEQRASLSMTLSCCAALAHSLGRLIAAAPKEDITPEQWAAWVEQNAQMVRETADEARRQREAVGADVPPVMVAEPKFLM